MRWDNAQIRALIRAQGGTIVAETQAEGFCTTAFVITDSAPNPNQEYLHLRGFNTNAELPDDGGDVEGVELNDGTDARGLITTRRPGLLRLYADLCVALRLQGYLVVPSLDEYF